jgi:acyl-coenzyme A thioesterase PaaI-like protein
MVCTEKSVPGVTIWTAAADERFCNPAGIIQGGFLSAICDSAMGASALTNARDRKVFVRNAEIKVSFLGAVMPGRLLECTATVISGGRSVAFVEAELFDIGPIQAAGSSGPGSPGAVSPGLGGRDGHADQDKRMVVKASSTYLYTDRS